MIDDNSHQVMDEEIPFERPRATELAPGVTLLTKSGQQVGNAIIVQEKPAKSKAGLEFLAGRTLWLVETDFGNRMVLSNEEILDWYELGFQQNYDTWFDARLEAIRKTIEPDA